MAEQKKKIVKSRPEQKAKETGFHIDNIIPQKYQTAALLAVIVVIFLAYLSPMYFGGKTFQSGDIITSKSMSSYLDKDREGYTLWYPYIFAGMPAYGLATDYKWFNLIWVGVQSVRSAFSAFFSVDYAKWSFYLILLAFTSYFLVYYLTKNRLIALFAALSTSFSTGLILFLFIGHVTKLTAICFFPLIFLMLLKFKDEGISVRNLAVLIISLQLAMQGWHVQIIFYTLFAVGIYFLFFIVRSFIIKNNDDLKSYFKSGLVFSGAFLIALIIQADSLTQIYEWNPYSTRGSQSVIDMQESVQKKASKDSDFYEYATNWSFSPGEVMTFIIPSWYGFGNSKYSGPLTRNQEVEVNTYFGQMPFVDVAMYMGIVVLWLALLSIYINFKRKNPLIQFYTVLALIALFISFGRTFPFLYDIMFYYFPYFDKFRVPSMILVLIQLTLPVVAALGIKYIIADGRKDKSLQNIIRYSLIGSAAVFVVFLLLSSPVKGWMESRVMDYAAENASNQNLANQFRALSGFIADFFWTDAMFAFGFLTLSIGFVYLYLINKLTSSVLVIILVIISAADLLRVSSRGAKYSDEMNSEMLFREPNYVTVIRNQKDSEPFRMLNLKQDGSMGSFNQNQNFNGFFGLHDFYGYSSLKPRAYQDYMDIVGPVNNTLWNMLNVKYIISDRQINRPGMTQISAAQNEFVYRNDSALPRAYFADSVEKSTPLQVLNLVKNDSFNPRAIVYTTDSELTIDKPDSTTSVSFVSYQDEKIVIRANASGNNLLFLGDTYFPSGWKAYIDGNETEIYRLNHGFRGVVVPKGSHELVFEYNPQSFVISKYLALSLSFLTIAGLGFGIFIESKRKKTATA